MANQVIKNEKRYPWISRYAGKVLIRRFLSSILTLFLLVSLLFILIRISPGDPAQKFISAQLSPELSQKISVKFHLNKPVIEQYLAFLTNAVKGDLGISYNYKLPVLEVIWEYFSFTLVFSLLSMFFQLVISFYLALFVARKKSVWLEKAISNLALLLYSVPAFVLGVALIYLFSVTAGIFPVSGLKSIENESFSFVVRLSDMLWHLILPLVTLSAAGTAMFYKYVKEGIDDVLRQTYVLNLRSGGLKEKVILRKHVMPNAIRPLITAGGVELGILLGGALITEVIFSLPGMGRLTIDAILSRDYPLVTGCVLIAGFVMILANFIADAIKVKIDKRLIKGLLN